MNVKTLTHPQQQPQAPKTYKQKPTIRQAIRTVFCVPQRILLYRFLVLDEVKCKTHTHQSTSSTSEAESGKSNRKCCTHTFKAPCLVVLNMHLTLHLLLFTQSMWVLIAIEIKNLILIKGKLYSIEDEDNNVLHLCLFLK